MFSVGLAAAGATALGGYIADRYGFNALFIFASVISFVASFTLLGLKKHLLPRQHEERVFPDRKHHGGHVR